MSVGWRMECTPAYSTGRVMKGLQTKINDLHTSNCCFGLAPMQHFILFDPREICHVEFMQYDFKYTQWLVLQATPYSSQQLPSL